MTLLTTLKPSASSSPGITFLAGTPSESITSDTSLTPSISFTGGLVDGDWILLICASNSSTGGFSTIPTGYQALVANVDSDAATGSTAGHHAIFYRKWVSGDTAPTVTFSSGRAGILPVRVRGADPTDLTGVGPDITKTTTVTTSVSAGSLTPVQGTVLACTFMGRSATANVFITWTPPAGMTEIGEAGGKSTTQTNASSMLAVMPVTIGTPTGIKTAIASSNTTGAVGVSFILKPAVAGQVSGSANFSGSGTLSATGVALTGGGGGGTGTITYAGAGTYFAATAANWAVPYPSPVVANDLLLLFATSGGGDVPAPAGWSTIHFEDVVSNPAGGLYYKFATGSEAGTLSVPTASAIGGAQIFRYSGVDTGIPIDASEVAVQNTTVTATTELPSITTVTPNAIIIYANAGNSGSVTMSSATGTERIDIGALGGGRSGALYDEVITTPGNTGTRTITLSSARENWGTMFALRPMPAGSNRTGSISLSGNGTLTAAGAALTGGTNSAFFTGSGTLTAGGVTGGTTPALVHRIVGVPTSTSQTVSVKVTNAASIRLKVSTDTAGTTGVVYGTPTSPSPLGNAKLTVSGLTPGTQYYYRVAMTGASGEILDSNATIGRLRTAPVGQTNFAFNFGSCTSQSTSAALTAIAARNDDLFFHLGDLYYADASGTGIDNFRSKFNTKITETTHAAVFATTPTNYTPSDHDGMNNNGTNGDDPVAWANWRTVYEESFPAPSTYYSFMYGRVLFIQIDDRNYKTITTATDNSSKTALGATQKQWLKDQITNTTAAAIVIAQSSPYIDPPSTGEDGWGGYTTERTELANFFAASGKKIVMLGGDMHAIAADDGTNAPGGITMLHGSPFNTTSSHKGGPYSSGTPYPAVGLSAQQYGHVDVVDTGTQISFVFTGYTSDNVARVTLTKNFTATPDIVNYTGSASFTGSGTLTASVVASTSGSVSLTGSGALTPTLTSTSHSRSVALTGSGTLTTQSTPSVPTNVPLTGSGTLSITVVAVNRIGGVALSGSGTVTGTAVGMSHSRAATLSGSGTLGFQTVAGGSASSALSGSGTLSAIGTVKSLSDSINLTGSGTLSSNAIASTIGSISLTGSGTLTASAVAISIASVNLTGSGTLSTTVGVVSRTGSVALTGSGTLTAVAGVVNRTGTVALTGSGTLSSNVTNLNTSISVPLSGTGSLGVQAGVSGLASISLSGTGTLSATPGTSNIVTNTSLTGSGTLTATATNVSASRTVSLTGSGTLNTTGNTNTPGSVVLTGSGTLSTSVIPRSSSTVSLTGSGTLILSATGVVLSGTANLNGSGTLNPVATNMQHNSTVNLSGSGTLSPTTSTTGAASAALSGSGTLSITVGNVVITRSANLSGSGTLTSITNSIATSRSISTTGSGTLSASGTSAIIANATLSGSGTLISSSNSVASASVQLSGSGTLSRTTNTAIIQNVNLTGSGTLTAVSTLVTQNTVVNLTGSGTLNTQTSGSGSTVFNPSGSGTLSTTTVSNVIQTRTFSGSGTLSASTSVNTSISVGLNGSGNLTLLPKPIVPRAISLSGSGTLSAAGINQTSANVNLSGSGTLTPTTNTVSINRTVALSGSGTISAVIDKVEHKGTANFTGTGTLGIQTGTSGTGSFTSTGSGTLTAVGSVRSLSGSASLAGTGSLSASGKPTIAVVSTFTSSGNLTTTGDPTLNKLTVLSGSGTLTAEASYLTQTTTVAFNSLGILDTEIITSSSGETNFSGSGVLTIITVTNPDPRNSTLENLTITMESRQYNSNIARNSYNGALNKKKYSGRNMPTEFTTILNSPKRLNR